MLLTPTLKIKHLIYIPFIDFQQTKTSIPKYIGKYKSYLKTPITKHNPHQNLESSAHLSIKINI